MTHDDLDRLLSSDDSLTPSSGFVNSVMEAVRCEAAEPVQPSFPWLRFAIGLLASGGAALAAALLVVHTAAPLAAAFAPLREAAPEIIYAAMALLASLAFLLVPRLLSRE